MGDSVERFFFVVASVAAIVGLGWVLLRAVL